MGLLSYELTKPEYKPDPYLLKMSPDIGLLDMSDYWTTHNYKNAVLDMQRQTHMGDLANGIDVKENASPQARALIETLNSPFIMQNPYLQMLLKYFK